MHELLFTTTILASFLGGVVALLAPCCVSVMLPAYFASSFRSRTHIVAMTLVFALGVGTVILPIGLGATALSREISGHHAVVFSIGGGAMIIGGLAILLGWKFMLPMPAMRGAGGSSVASVYSLGAFSGIASSCCAPVLAGVVAVSAATASFVPALLAGVAYVFGMVAPLAVLALVWDRRDWGNSRLLSARTLSIRLGRFRRRVPLASLLSGVLLVAMGALTIVLAVRGPSMPTNGWQVRFTAWLDHQTAVVERALSGLPPWLPAAVIFVALALLVMAALRGRRDRLVDRDVTDDAADSHIGADEGACCPPSPVLQPQERQTQKESS